MLNPIVQHQHMAALEKGEVALYPFQNIQVNTLGIPKNELVLVRQWIFSKEDIPKRIAIGLVKSEAYEGRLDADPFNFRPFNLNKLAVTSYDDLSQYALSEFDFDSDRWLVAFEKNFNERKDLNVPDSSKLNRASWVDNNFVQLIELSSSDTSPTGNLKLQFTFSKATENPLIVILLSEKNSVLEIDKHGFATVNTIQLLTALGQILQDTDISFNKMKIVVIK